MYSKEEFSAMNFNIHGKKSPIQDKALSRIDFDFDLFDEPDRNKVIKYFCYCYDSKSPFVTQIQDVNQRKELALDEAGITDEDHRERLMELDNSSYISLLIAIMRSQKSKLYRLIIVNEEAFNEYETQVLRKLSSDKDKDLMQALTTKDKILDSLDTIRNRLEAYYRKFFNEEEVVVKKVSFSPEGMKDIV